MVDRYRPVADCVVATVTAYNAAHPDGEFVKWADYEALAARVAELEKDAAFGRIAMRFVDRAGDYCPQDPAERICDEFEAAIAAEVDRQAGEILTLRRKGLPDADWGSHK